MRSIVIHFANIYSAIFVLWWHLIMLNSLVTIGGRNMNNSINVPWYHTMWLIRAIKYWLASCQKSGQNALRSLTFGPVAVLFHCIWFWAAKKKKHVPLINRFEYSIILHRWVRYTEIYGTMGITIKRLFLLTQFNVIDHPTQMSRTNFPFCPSWYRWWYPDVSWWKWPYLSSHCLERQPGNSGTLHHKWTIQR